MMYLALSYDHRVVDGKEAVTFLVRIKECIENPARLLLGCRAEVETPNANANSERRTPKSEASHALAISTAPQ
jgi:hypothetical protein